MTPFDKFPTPTTKRMADDMKIRHFAESTIDSYVYHVRKFEEFLTKPIADADAEDIRNFQLHLINVRKVSWSSFNQAVCGLRFLYQFTLPKPGIVSMVPYGKRPKKLPVVLGGSEVDALLQCVHNLKHQTILMTLYATGMRISEGSNLKAADLDSKRMQLKVNNGKGGKQRLVPLSPRLLTQLRMYWKEYRPTDYLFPGKTPDIPINPNSVQKIIKLAAKEAGILKHVTPHTLRHSYATGLLEAGVDVLTISRLLGHSCFTTTMIYLHCRQQHFESAPSPLDWLPVRQLPSWKDPTVEQAPLPEQAPPVTETPPKKKTRPQKPDGDR